MSQITVSASAMNVPQAIWSGLRREDVAALEGIVDRRSVHRYPADVELTRQGEMNDVIIVLHEGIIKLVHVASTGHELILGLRFGLSVIGLASVCANRPDMASALTLTQCAIQTLAVEQFSERVRAAPDLMWTLLRMEAMEVLEHMGRSADVVCCSSRVRLAKLLLAMAHAERPTTTNRVKLTLPLKRLELASLVGITPEHLSRLFREFQDSGVVSVDKGWIVLRDLERVEAEATSGLTEPSSRRRIARENRSLDAHQEHV